MIIYIWLNLNNISGRACSYERDSAICFRVSLRRGEEIYFPFRENVPKSSSVSKTRANYDRKNSGRMPPQEFRHRGHHTVKLDVSTSPVYSRFVMTAIISSLNRAVRNYVFIAYLVHAIIKFHLKITVKLIFIKLSSEWTIIILLSKQKESLKRAPRLQKKITSFTEKFAGT